MRGIAAERETIGDEAAGDGESEWKGATRPDDPDIAEMQPEPLLQLGMKPGIARAMMRRASVASSLHTIDERLPRSGRIANGPPGRKCSSARP